MRLCIVLAGALVLGAITSTGEAHAGNNPAAAQALFEEARVLMASGDYEAACKKLEGSQALDPGPGTEYNLALCYEKSGRTASAWATFLSAAVTYKATNRPEWETRARDRAAVLASRLSRVTILAPTPAPADLRITRDNVPVLAAEVGAPIPLDPGRHVIDAVAEGRPKFTLSFELAPATNETIRIVLGGGPPEAAHEAVPSSSRRTMAYVLGGAGIVGIAFGGIAGLVAIDKNASSTKDCPQDGVCKSSSALADNRSASDWAAISTVSFIAGGVLLGAAGIVFLTAPKTTTKAFVSPSVGLASAGIVGAW